jgi:hypothetical protein
MKFIEDQRELLSALLKPGTNERSKEGVEVAHRSVKGVIQLQIHPSSFPSNANVNTRTRPWSW